MKKIKTIKCDIGVRYWEDTDVNGVEDVDFMKTKGEGKPLIPCAVKIKEHPEDYTDHYRWRPIIDVETGKIINWNNGNTAFVHYKVCDDCCLEAIDELGDVVCNNDGYYYCPDFLCPADKEFGDYVIMKIDSEGYIEDFNIDEVYKWVEGQLENK